MRNQSASMATRAWAEIDHVVSPADGFFVVLHDQDCIAQIAQFFKRFQQTTVIAMMQAD